MHKALLSLAIAVFITPIVFGSPGQLDPTFGIGGIAAANIGKLSGDNAVAAVLQPDGKIVFVGVSTSDSENLFDSGTVYLSRINIDGSLDTSFGADAPGFTKVPGGVAGVDLDSKGRIVIGGRISPSQNDSVFLITRFNSDGSSDDEFGDDGVVTTSFNDLIGRGAVSSIKVQSDDKIVAVGTTIGPASILAARYNTDGSLDETFAGDGRDVISVSETASRANVVAMQPDGKILIGGSAREATGTITDFAIIRLNADGTLDPTFDGDGKITTKFAATTSAVIGIDVQDDGKIVAAGDSSLGGGSENIAVARYNVDGSLDESFDGDGKVITDISRDIAAGVQIQPDGKIVVGGQSIVAPSILFGMLAIRYNTDGSLDDTFNGSGIVVTDLPGIHSVAKAVLIQPDSKVLTIGYTGFNVDILLARHDTNGQHDGSFGTDGVALIEFGNSSDMIFEMAEQPDGKIVAGGYSFDGIRNQNVSVAKFNANGTIDVNFGTGGSVTKAVTFNGFPIDSFANEVIVQPDGKILVSVGTYSANEYVTLRYNSDGTPDGSFGKDGVSTLSLSTEGDIAYDMALLPDGKIIIVGQSGFEESQNWMLRLSQDGTLDPGFGDNGKVLMAVNGRHHNIRAVSLQPDGKIVVTGASQNDCLTARYHSDGMLDLSFGTDGAVYTPIVTTSGLQELTIQSDGKILALGNTITGLQSGSVLIRYNADGSLDTTFDDDAILSVLDTSGRDLALGNMVESNGKIVMAGGIYSGTAIPRDQNSMLIRLEADGSYDNSFGDGGIAITPLQSVRSAFHSVLLLANGQILGGGYSNNGLNNDFTLARFQAERSAKFDFDGDGRSDVAVFRPSVGDWYRIDSSNGAFVQQHFGQAGDRPVPADFDGDGKTDIAVFRPADSSWYVLNSSDGTFSSTQFGVAEDLPVTEDYDGDGRADIAVYRPTGGVWYRLDSSTGSFVTIQFGVAEDKPAIGDFDGDGRADISVYRPSLGTWYRLNSSTGEFVAVNFGVPEDLPTAADYDGDGKTDISVYRPSAGTWYRLNSSTGEFIAQQFGVNGDRPAAADFDGDGETDLAVFRPSTGNWYILNTTGGFNAVQFGVSEDRPASNAFVY